MILYQFSSLAHRLQDLINILNNLPYKYILSKGSNGDNLEFPSNRFIGENFIDQLAVLQVVDCIITHGNF